MAALDSGVPSARTVPLRLRADGGEVRAALSLVGAADYPLVESTKEQFLHPAKIEIFAAFPAGKRRRSYLLGRRAAKTALSRLLGEVDPGGCRDSRRRLRPARGALPDARARRGQHQPLRNLGLCRRFSGRFSHGTRRRRAGRGKGGNHEEPDRARRIGRSGCIDRIGDRRMNARLDRQGGALEGSEMRLDHSLRAAGGGPPGARLGLYIRPIPKFRPVQVSNLATWRRRADPGAAAQERAPDRCRSGTRRAQRRLR